MHLPHGFPVGKMHQADPTLTTILTGGGFKTLFSVKLEHPTL